LSARPEDFIVEEIPAYAPDGSGDHWFVRVRKVGLSTPRLCTMMADAAGIPPREIGIAGRKDELAVTTQWISLPVEPVDPEDPRVTFLEQDRHRHKLRRGHLKANRFEIRLVGVQPDAEALLPALIERVTQGVPNYFGPQRFGYEGSSLGKALAFLDRPRRRVRDPRFLVNVIQAALFNSWLGQRVADGFLDTAIDGDLLRKRETGGLFVCTEPEVDQERAANGEVDAMGPLYGPKMMAAAGLAAEREEELRSSVDLDASAWKTMKRFGPGGRRLSRLVPGDLSVHYENETLLAQFTLPSGAYATTVLAELSQPVDGALLRPGERST
jgi:tRNA pseudouridine13 synthase